MKINFFIALVLILGSSFLSNAQTVLYSSNFNQLQVTRQNGETEPAQMVLGKLDIRQLSSKKAVYAQIRSRNDKRVLFVCNCLSQFELDKDWIKFSCENQGGKVEISRNKTEGSFVIQTASDSAIVLTNISEEKLSGKEDKTQAFFNAQPEPAIFVQVENMPSYKGGIPGLMKYLSTNTNYPKKAKEEGIEGMVIVTFVVEKNGKVTNVSILKGVSPELDTEAIRVVKAMDKWKPGSHHGKKVPVEMKLPINFKLSKKKK